MARKDKKEKSKDNQSPAWLVTFSDMMTLLLTFFVLLLSMASLTQERKKLLALGSISQTFGMGEQTMSILGNKLSEFTVEPGPMQDLEKKDLSTLKNLTWEQKAEDVQFKSNKFVQVLSIGSGVLFEPGKNELSPEGKKLLNRVYPVLIKSDFPLLLAGHTSLLLDEFPRPSLSRAERMKELDFSWMLSLQRALSVYKYLLEKGVVQKKLKVEAFGKYRPDFSNQDREGRKKNRRVEIILDKRSTLGHNPNKLKKFPKIPRVDERLEYRGFEFEVDGNRQE